MAAPRPILGYYRGGSLTRPMLITCILHIRPEGHREPHNEAGSISPTERLVGFEPGIFRFGSKRLNPLGHSAQIKITPKQFWSMSSISEYLLFGQKVFIGVLIQGRVLAVQSGWNKCFGCKYMFIFFISFCFFQKTASKEEKDPKSTSPDRFHGSTSGWIFFQCLT